MMNEKEFMRATIRTLAVVFLLALFLALARMAWAGEPNGQVCTTGPLGDIACNKW